MFLLVMNSFHTETAMIDDARQKTFNLLIKSNFARPNLNAGPFWVGILTFDTAYQR